MSAKSDRLGQARVQFRCGAPTMHIFVLTLGFLRPGLYWGSPNEQMGSFLEAHERAFWSFQDFVETL